MEAQFWVDYRSEQNIWVKYEKLMHTLCNNKTKFLKGNYRIENSPPVPAKKGGSGIEATKKEGENSIICKNFSFLVCETNFC